MKLEILSRTSADASAFVKHWSKFYTYPNASLYDDNIGKPLTSAKVWDLYKWKNGTSEISARKRQSIAFVYLHRVNDAPKVRTLEAGRNYVQHLGGGGIWDIFWLHCLNPELFPIFDQHTYRAMAKITGTGPSEIPSRRDQKIAIYFDRYRDFLASFNQIGLRDLDKALFAYGRFLKSEFCIE